MTNALDTLTTALYARIDDELKASPWPAPWRPAVGITPTPSDAELITLAVMFEYGLAERHMKLLRPARKGKPSQPGHTCSSRCGR